MIHKVIFKLGQALRNPSLNDHYDFLLQSDHWTRDELEKYQLERLKELMTFAYEHSPFYRKEFEEAGVLPSDVQSLDDLKKLPIIDKKIVAAHADEIKSDAKFNRLQLSETSGTSGTTLQIYRSEEWDSHNRAAWFRGFSWYGVKPWDRNGYFWGFNIAPSERWKTRVLDWLVNRFRVFSYDKDEIAVFVNKLKKGAVYIGGYSSMIYETARMVNQMGLSGGFKLKMVKGTSEKIYDHYQDEVKKAFGCKLISEYGGCESGMIAFECPCGHMHVVMEHVIVEEVDGEIVVTNLMSKSFPFIRYKLGDSIQLAPDSFRCECGRESQVILDVLGRVGKKVVGKEKTYPSLTFYYVFKNLGLQKGIALNYQAQQYEKGKIVLLIEQNQPEYEPLIKEEIKKYFTDDIDFEIKWGVQIHPVNGKLRDFVSNIESENL